MKKMSTYGKGSEDAVSPVIGVILMVAITVILAAVIAAFVFGMAGNVSKTRTVAVTAQKSGQGANTAVTLTNMGGNDAASVESFTWTLNGGAHGGQELTTTIGSYAKSAGNVAYKDPTRVIVTATFQDGTSQVVLDTTV